MNSNYREKQLQERSKTFVLSLAVIFNGFENLLDNNVVENKLSIRSLCEAV